MDNKGQDEFDDIIKRKLDSQEFMFDEKNWEKARDMIDASRRSNRKPFLLLLSAALVLVSGVAAWYVIHEPATNNDSAHPIASIESKPSQLKTAEIRSQNNEQVAAEAPAENKTTTEVSGKTEADAVTSQKLAGSTITNAGQQQSSATNAASAHNKELLAELSSKKRDNGNTLNKSDAKESEISADRIRYSKTPGGSLAAKKSGQTANNGETNSGSGSGTLEKGTSDPGKAASDDAAFAADKKLPDATNENPASDNNTASNANQDKTTEENVSPATDASSAKLAKVDTASKVIGTAAELEQSKFRTDREPASFVYAEAGANYLFGWNNAGQKDANGFNPSIGLHFLHNFSKRVGITIGTNYTSVGNLKNSAHTSTVSHYELGKVDDITIITPTRLHYFSATGKIGVIIKKDNLLSIGYNFAYLLNVDNKMDTYSQRYNTQGEHKITKTSGFDDGFRTYDMQVTVAFKRTIYKDLGVNAEAFFGLADVKTNGFFGTSGYERNSGFKLTLTYNIFKK